MTLSYKIRVVKKYKLFKKSNENYGIENHNNNIKILLESFRVDLTWQKNSKCEERYREICNLENRGKQRNEERSVEP